MKKNLKEIKMVKFYICYEDVTSIEDHINLLREENKKRILQYIIHQTSVHNSSNLCT